MFRPPRQLLKSRQSFHASEAADRLIAATDQALYRAKKDGKNRFAVYDHAPKKAEVEPSPPLVPATDAGAMPELRQSA
jgi:hypothetical protein